ncbi:MAG: hypothetical protein EB072_20295 [Betaproteobacteria bacterium]|nr:hypothetical protein [Betaproteobacteria bacterium]
MIKDSVLPSFTELQALARLMRFRTVRTSHLSGTPHLGSCLSCVDLLVYFYWRVLRINPKNPKDPLRDRFILSKGHAAPSLFQVLAERGFFPLRDLDHYGEDGSIFGLTIAIDYNKWQATGRSNDVLALAPLADKWRSFGWCVSEVDGHDVKQIEEAISAHASDDRPKAIIAHTIKGRGVSFMEDNNNWHYRIPTKDEVHRAADELDIATASVDLEGRVPISHG